MSAYQLLRAMESDAVARRLFDEAQRDVACGLPIEPERLRVLIDLGARDVGAEEAAKREIEALQDESSEAGREIDDWRDWGADVEALLEDVLALLPDDLTERAERLIQGKP